MDGRRRVSLQALWLVRHTIIHRRGAEFAEMALFFNKNSLLRASAVKSENDNRT
jgi:hypothetical protein